jgi:DNA polymerase-3 subunit epsilon
MPMYLFFDTETTGLPRNWNAPVTDLNNWPRLVELAWMLCDEEGNDVESHSAIVRPDGFEIPAEAAAVHGITTVRAHTEGVALDELLQEFARDVDMAHVLIAHNIRFDEKIMGAELLRAGVSSGFSDRDRFCTMTTSTELCAIPSRYGFKWPKLSELHQKLFGSIPSGAHAAGVDVAMCARCFFEMKRLGLIALPKT